MQEEKLVAYNRSGGLRAEIDELCNLVVYDVHAGQELFMTSFSAQPLDVIDPHICFHPTKPHLLAVTTGDSPVFVVDTQTASTYAESERLGHIRALEISDGGFYIARLGDGTVQILAEEREEEEWIP